MPLAAGTHVGAYEITGQLGAGGMGEVYSATDTVLKRQVALKVLPPEVANDPERVARFQREAEVLASLNHPNIAHLYGLERSGGWLALVMELVEGPTLADRIAQGAIPIDEALPIAKQIAEALEGAHEQGIIHRDLKPANIKVREDGTVKVLDFGLAKAMEPVSGVGSNPAAMTNSPTITSPALMTGVGMLLGTAAYMSPEQAKGRPADTRTDIWAFGCVLYEMVTGRRAFAAVTGSNDKSEARHEEIADVLAAVLTRAPDWSALPAGTPAGVRRLLHRCLDRDRRQRLQSAVDVRLRLDDAIAEPDDTPIAAVSVAPNRGWIVAAMVGVVAVILSVPAIRHVREVASIPPEMRTEIVTPLTTDRESFALSPDGRQLVFAAENNGRSQLWMRPLSSSVAHPLPDTEDGARPFWAPDGKSLAFFAGGKLKVLDLASGRVHPTPFVVTAVRGGAWNDKGVVLVAQSGNPLVRTTPAGETPKAVTKLDQQTSDVKPQFLPDGTHFIFYAVGNPDNTGVYLGSLESDVVSRLTAADAAGAFLPSDYLLWPRDGTLWAQHVDLARGVLSGNRVALSGSVAFENGGVSAISVSANGLIALRAGAASRRQLEWFDRHGKLLGALGDADDSSFNSPRLSRDGQAVTVTRTINGNTDVWLVDSDHTKPLTSDPATDRISIWSPDGTKIIFDSNRTGIRQLYKMNVETTGTETLLFQSPVAKTPQSWSTDGRFLLYAEAGTSGIVSDLWILPLNGEPPFPFLKTPATEKGGEFSPDPDSRWIAYMSDESSQPNIYVRRFVRPGSSESMVQRQISTAGGIYPKWARDGKELYYLAPDGAMMAVPIRMSATTFEKTGPPAMLFQTRVYGGGSDNQQGPQFDVAPDGRFLMNTVMDDATPITVIQNWTPPPTR
jgi:serine/threonine protein kinase